MKKLILTLGLAVTSYFSYAQNSNPWPTTGNVGIGTSSPTTTLDVYTSSGTTQTNIAKFNNSTNGHYTTFTASGSSSVVPTWTNGSQILEFVSGTSGKGIIDSYQSPLVFQTLREDRMTIGTNGNVGIGTMSPDEKLTVKGKIHSQEVIVDAMTTVPDYVFEDDYKLKSLSDIKAYVDANHHLPEIPSAKEMEKNGIQLGDMNMKLLKKVEELTLYLIEKDRQYEEQQKINKALQNQIDRLVKGK